jgi:hypothetical protein
VVPHAGVLSQWTQGLEQAHMDTRVGAGSQGHRGWSGLTGTQRLEQAHMDTRVGAGSQGHRGWSRLTWTQRLEQAHMDTRGWSRLTVIQRWERAHLEQAHHDTSLRRTRAGTEFQIPILISREKGRIHCEEH